MHMAQPRRPPSQTPHRRRYPVGELRPAAIARGRTIVALYGADALTLRGLARDLGVSAPALLYYFGTRAGLLAAVAESVHEDLAEVAGRPPRPTRAQEEAREAAARWLDFAEQNPNLYRLAFGQGWHSPGLGWHGGIFALPVPTDSLEGKLRRSIERDRRHRHLPADTPDVLPRYVAAGIHGLATARLDGASAEVVRRALDLLTRTIPASRTRQA